MTKARGDKLKQAGDKSIRRPEYIALLGTLRHLRERAGLTQAELAALFNRDQSFVAQAERGAVRLDALQIYDWAHFCGSDLPKWAKIAEKAIESVEPPPSPAPRKKAK